uniref:Uncharacterized protein n=1 Tax=Heterorhabditis bacteriophora TaxID=37862 RepID=A0A1I7WCQ6_HETBA
MIDWLSLSIARNGGEFWRLNPMIIRRRSAKLLPQMETIKTAQISAKGTSAEQTLNAKYNAPPSQDEDVDDYKRKRIEKDEIRIAPTPNTRKSVPSLKEDKDNVAGTANHRPRIQGPILKPLNSFEEDAEEPGLGFGSRFGTGVGFGAHPPDFDYVIAHPRQRLVEPSGLPQYSSPFATPPPTSDYHSRTTPTYKSYKFTQKLSQRPRLRIRRPGNDSLLIGQRDWADF